MAIALEMTLTGDLIDAERAHAIGLINRVVPADDVLAEAMAIAERIAANGPLGLAATKELVRLAARDDADDWLRIAIMSSLRPGRLSQ